MTPIEKLKREFEIAADDTNVRLGQARDHLIWSRIDDDGEKYNVYIFWLNDETGSIVMVYPGHFNLYESSNDFLDSITDWRLTNSNDEYE